MDKEKFINKLNEELEELKGKELLYFNMRDSVQEARCTNRIFGIQYALNFARLLEEPQKVKVPKFVAEWIEQAKKERQSLYEAMWNIESSTYYHKYDNTTYQWMFEGALHDEHQELFAEAYMHGYEIEEEPKWIVCYSTMYLKSPLETGQIESVEITPKKELAYHFKSYKEAKQQTSSIGGAVEKV